MCGVAALGLSAARASFAEAEDAARPVLWLHIAASEAVTTSVSEHLRPRLGALGVDLSVEPVGGIDVDAVLGTAPATGTAAPLAQAWLEGRSPTEATLFLVPRRADRVLARRLGR